MRKYKDNCYKEWNPEFVQKDGENKLILLKLMKTADISRKYYVLFKNSITRENGALEHYVQNLRNDYERDILDVRASFCFLLLLRHSF